MSPKQERDNPAIVTIPLSLPGHEIEHPMAIVILGDLLTSTLLNLFAVPSLYLRFGKGRRAAPAAALVPSA